MKRLPRLYSPFERNRTNLPHERWIASFRGILKEFGYWRALKEDYAGRCWESYGVEGDSPWDAFTEECSYAV